MTQGGGMGGVTLESLLSEQLLKLSFDDRNEIEEEIHGVGCRAVQETPEFVRAALVRFDVLVNERKAETSNRMFRNVVRVNTIDEDAAASSSSSAGGCYLNDPGVRLRFLRAEFFVVDKAVNRFVLFLELMSEIFGDYVAERPVQYSDFTTKEKALLKKSRMQFLPFRDRSGRRTLTGVGHSNFLFEYEPKWKILMYLMWVISEEVETQRKGVVNHIFPFDEPGTRWDKSSEQGAWKKDVITQKKALMAFPVRLAARHLYCRDTPFYRFATTLQTYFHNPTVRLITKVHFGEQTELLYKMASFGVPVDVLPITPSGSIKFSNHCAWLGVIENKELGSLGSDVVDCPLIEDVVFRIGKGLHRQNPGNTYFRELIQVHSPEHYLGDNKQKEEITKLVYDAIVQERNGRFLEWWKEGKTWRVIQDPTAARQKIAKTFNNYKNDKLKQGPAIRKLEETISRTAPIDKAEAPEPSNPSSALQEYYSKQHPSKRLKTCDFLTRSGSKENTEGNGCFGKAFFPLDAEIR